MNYDVNGKVNAIKTDIAPSEEFDDYDDDNLDFEQQDSDNNDSESNDDKNKNLKKKLIKMMLIIGGGMIILLLILLLVSKINLKSYKYEDVEEIMKQAAENYFKENGKNLPQDETQTVEIEVSTLVANEKMKNLDEYLGEGSGCTGKVQVKKTASAFIYTPYLTCGDKYSTKFLAETITNESNLVGSGYGLYLLNNNSYVYRGETVNNFIRLEKNLWRVLKVNPDNTIAITIAKPSDYMYAYDDRYNQSIDFEYGINNFQNSRIREQLQKMYNTTDPDDTENYILSENDKTHLVKYDICTGKIGDNDTIHDNSLECTQTISDYIGLLTASDYMNASIDTGCSSTISSSCQNYNYLGITGSFWTVTPSNKNTYSVYAIRGGSLKSSSTNEVYKIRPVVTLASNTLISGGEGTEENPYLVK